MMHCNVSADSTVQQLNRECYCLSLEQGAIERVLRQDAANADVVALIGERCPNLFSATPVFISSAQLAQLRTFIEAVETVVALPSYRETVLAAAPAIAQRDPMGASGVFYGYDFHVHEDGFGLIEINTNAGGAMLNTVLARAQHACCRPMDNMLGLQGDADKFEAAIVAMFRAEWNMREGRELATIAIVDEQPEQQYLYAEFLLFQRLFERHGIKAVIADPGALAWRGGRLQHKGMAIDLVYNRLTDFMLSAPASAALRAAYEAGAAMVTPHPQAHALYANKHNLVLLSDEPFLRRIGVDALLIDVLLNAIPRAERVHADNAERLWSERRKLFFKPLEGFGSRAIYRGDKLTRRVWEEILSGDYIAQDLVAPGERAGGTVDNPESLKFDLRAFVYRGEVQWTAARLYRGQTTNFRTPGGGFAPVYPL
jgi:hypothetical protein